MNEAEEAAKEAAAKLYCDFKLIVHEVKGRARWQGLRSRDETLDRDAEAVRVWSELETTHGAVIEKQYHSLEYHRLWLSDWLLRRYNLRQARKVVGGEGRWARNAHFFLLTVILMIYALRHLGFLGAHQTQWTLLLCAVAYAAMLILLTGSFRKKLPDREAFAVATQSLIPRLAGAAAVGLLFLFSSSDLIPVLLTTKPWWLLALLIAVYGYLLLEMSRRVHPLPRLRRLALHALDISATALAHSLTLTLLAEGALRKLLHDRGPFGWRESLSLVVFVFSIGLVVNLIWAEQPITEPL
jgi:hypothetical protein